MEIPDYDFISFIHLVLKVAVVEQVSDFNYLGNLIFGEEKDRIKLQGRYNKMNVIIKQYFGNCTTTNLKLRLHNITLKAALFCGRET